MSNEKKGSIRSNFIVNELLQYNIFYLITILFFNLIAYVYFYFRVTSYQAHRLGQDMMIKH